MENALKEMSGSFADQLKILELLKNLDIKRMTTANVSILQQFEKVLLIFSNWQLICHRHLTIFRLFGN